MINNNHDYQVVFANESDKVSIEVEGVEELLNNVLANDFNATIDVENLKSGINTVKVDLSTSKSYLNYRLLSPEKIRITLKK